MQTISKVVLASFFALTAYNLPASAQIAIQFQGSGTALLSTDSAGLPTTAQTNWNVETGASFSNAPLVEADGITAGGVLNGGANGAYFAGGNVGAPAGNSKLTSGEIYNGWPGSPTLTVSSIPYANYDVIFYASTDNTGRYENVELTAGASTSTFGFNLNNGLSSWVQGTNTTTWDGTGTKPTGFDANYVEFTNVSGSSFTLNWGAPGNGGLNGIQIIPVAAAPEPSSLALMFLGLGGLGLLIRKRSLAVR